MDTLETTAKKDRHYICQIGRLFWGDDKQCYAADAVYRQVKIQLQTPQTTDNRKRRSSNKGSQTIRGNKGKIYPQQRPSNLPKG